MDDMLHTNNDNTLECSNCHCAIKPGDEYALLEDESILCLGCYGYAFPECEFCGKRVPEDEILFWGDCHCCPDCYEEFNPSFNPEQNEEETTEAYEAMLKKYLGRKSRLIRETTVQLETEDHDCGLVIYRMEVEIDENGIICGISRLTADILLSESEKSTDWGSYIIRNEDYEEKVRDMMVKLDLE